MIRKALVTALLAVLAGLPLQAVDTYAVDRTHSEVGFQIRHLISKVRGDFNAFQGTIQMDPDDPSKSSVAFTIDAASIDTANDNRDQHLRSEDFFHVEQYPQITFESSKVEKTGENTYDVTGTLTMRGVSKQITLPVTYLGEVKDPRGNVKAGFETGITLNRKDFGVNWNAALDQGGFILGDEVEVSIDVQAAKQQQQAETGG